MFLAGDVEAIHARFAPQLAKLLSPEAFREGWTGIETKNGKLLSFGAPVIRDVGATQGKDVAATQAVLLAAKFERADWTLTLAFDDGGRITSLRFTPTALAEAALKPVEFQAPPYARADRFQDKDVVVGKDPWALPGTISMPVGKGPFPGVVLVHGSGPHDRDETVGAVKPFRDLAWGLASQGIAVLRYEKRSKAHGSKMGSAPLTVKDEIIDDAVAAVELLRDTKGVDPRRVIVLGHSQGGGLAPRIATADGHVAGVVVLAGPTRSMPDLIQDQLDYLVAAGAMREEDAAPMREDAERIRKVDPVRTPPSERIMGAPPAYWIDYRSYDAPATARKNALPILVVQGGRDYQVTAKDLAGWKAELEKAPFARFQTFPKANHLFVFGEGNSLPGEYRQPGNVAAEVVSAIAKWVKAVPPRK
jgi:dienelactone hydrolase